MTEPPLEPRTHARHHDPRTSHEAAAQLSDKQTMMRRLLWAFLAQPLTAEQAADACGYGAESGAWKRVSDLANRGLIEDTDATRLGRSGRSQIVWRITNNGRNAL